MFGLMRPRTCAGKQEHRLYYCGACKTLGSVYGQKSRMLLNHDTIDLTYSYRRTAIRHLRFNAAWVKERR